MTPADNLADTELDAYQRKSMRGLRGIGAGILVLEALVVALSIPVLLKQGHGGTAWRHVAVVAVSVISVLLIVAAAELRRPWGVRFATVMQVLGLIAGASSFALLFLMALFAGIWAYWLSMLRALRREQAAERAGVSPGR